MKKILPVAAAIGLMMTAAVSADTIYGWTDEHGIQRFSNHPPPQHIDNFVKYESPPSPSDDAEETGKRRSSYDQMVQEATAESRQLERQREAAAASAAAEKKRLEQERQNAVIEAERSRLEQQIKAIENRALGPTYTKGMKQAQIDKILKQIEALENNPDAAKAQPAEESGSSNSGY